MHLQLFPNQGNVPGWARSIADDLTLSSDAYVPHREAQKEVDLLEKKLQRLEAARAAEVAALAADLRAARADVAERLGAQDAKVTDLIEELGSTQALLSQKEAALAEVWGLRFPALSASITSLQPGRNLHAEHKGRHLYAEPNTQ